MICDHGITITVCQWFKKDHFSLFNHWCVANTIFAHNGNSYWKLSIIGTCYPAGNRILFFYSEGFFGVLERGKAASILEGKSSSHRCCCCFYDMEIDGEEPPSRAAHHYTYAQYYPPFHMVVLYQRWKCRLFKKAS